MTYQFDLLQNMDLTQHKMVYDGLLTWRISKTRLIDVQLVLFVDLLVILQRQDDRLVLRYESMKVEDQKYTHSPIIKIIPNLIVKENAAGKYYRQTILKPSVVFVH